MNPTACSKTIESFNLQKYLARGGHEAYRKRLEHVLQLLADGVITVPTEGAVSASHVSSSHLCAPPHMRSSDLRLIGQNAAIKGRCATACLSPAAGQVFKLDQVREAVAAAQKAAGGEKVFLEG